MDFFKGWFRPTKMLDPLLDEAFERIVIEFNGADNTLDDRKRVIKETSKQIKDPNKLEKYKQEINILDIKAITSLKERVDDVFKVLIQKFRQKPV